MPACEGRKRGRVVDNKIDGIGAEKSRARSPPRWKVFPRPRGSHLRAPLPRERARCSRLFRSRPRIFARDRENLLRLSLPPPDIDDDYVLWLCNAGKKLGEQGFFARGEPTIGIHFPYFPPRGNNFATFSSFVARILKVNVRYLSVLAWWEDTSGVTGRYRGCCVTRISRRLGERRKERKNDELIAGGG